MLKPKKCELFKDEVEFLGKLVSAKGVSVSPSKVNAVKKWPMPNTKKELMSFLGFANYHRDHVSDFAEMTLPCMTWRTPQICQFGRPHTLKRLKEPS